MTSKPGTIGMIACVGRQHAGNRQPRGERGRGDVARWDDQTRRDDRMPINTALAASLPRLRRVLEQQRCFRLEQLAQLASQEDAAHLANLGVHLGDVDSSADSARLEVSAAVAAAARRALDDIEAALERMRTGRYGRCERCRDEIPLPRLVILPQAGLCMSCQRRAELRR